VRTTTARAIITLGEIPLEVVAEGIEQNSRCANCALAATARILLSRPVDAAGLARSPVAEAPLGRLGRTAAACERRSAATPGRFGAGRGSPDAAAHGRCAVLGGEEEGRLGRRLGQSRLAPSMSSANVTTPAQR
jgi:hypothetical protein